MQFNAEDYSDEQLVIKHLKGDDKSFGDVVYAGVKNGQSVSVGTLLVQIDSSETTEIVKSVNGTANDLQIGKTITANGKANEDGSITAQSIQIRQGTAKPLRP